MSTALADQLERRFGSCPLNRRGFLRWVDDQMERCARMGLPDEEVQCRIEAGYVQWRAELLEIDLDWESALAVGREFPDREQPTDQEREPLDDA